MRRFTDEHGNEVRPSDERLRHILRRHPEMAFQLRRFAETLASPEVRLHYRLYPDLRGRNRHMCLEVRKETDYSFILTACLDRRIKGE